MSAGKSGMKFSSAVMAGLLVLSSISPLWAHNIRIVVAGDVAAVRAPMGAAVEGVTAPALDVVLPVTLPEQAQLAQPAPAQADVAALNQAAVDFTPASPADLSRAEAAADHFFSGSHSVAAAQSDESGPADAQDAPPATLPMIALAHYVYPGTNHTIQFESKHRAAIESLSRGYVALFNPEDKQKPNIASVVRFEEVDYSDPKLITVHLKGVRAAEIMDIERTQKGPDIALLNYKKLSSGDSSRQPALVTEVKVLTNDLAGQYFEREYAPGIQHLPSAQAVATAVFQLLVPKLSAATQKAFMMKETVTEQLEFLASEMKTLKLARPAPNDQTIEGLTEIIERSGMPADIKAAARRELGNLRGGVSDPGKTIAYLQWLTRLPWNQRSEDRVDLKQAKGVLDRDHFGLEKVKERVLESLAKRAKSGKTKGGVILFVGPPGVGKTSIGMAIAEAMGRRFVHESVSGVDDPLVFRGMARGYQDSHPGLFIRKMVEAGTVNPVFLIDEVDKLSQGAKNPMGVLLELLDPKQNHAFHDTYLGLPYDLSEVLFIVTANDLNAIPDHVRDRMEKVYFTGYSTEEKIQIADRHIVPAERKEHGLSGEELSLSQEALQTIIDGYTMEPGVRDLRNKIADVMRKVTKGVVSGEEKAPGRLEGKDVAKYLGKPIREDSEAAENDLGLATGLAVSNGAGSVLNIEVNLVPGKGELILRQQMLKMTNDSAHNAYSYVKSRAEALRIVLDNFFKKDIDVQFSPAHDIDGPSAGTAMATAIASRLTGRKVKTGIAMTGEVTVTGRVLKIGGLVQKVMAAERAGYHTVIFPKQNLRDVEGIPEDVKKKIKLIPVERADEVLELALEKPVTSLGSFLRSFLPW